MLGCGRCLVCDSSAVSTTVIFLILRLLQVFHVIRLHVIALRIITTTIVHHVRIARVPTQIVSLLVLSI